MSVKYIHFVRIADKPKTSVWSCRNIKEGYEIGIVKWNPGWRQYCFFPGSDMVLSVGCMQDIGKFIGERRTLKQVPEQPVKTPDTNPEDFRYVEEEPPDYKECPCWISPCDPDEVRGSCQGGGDCKLWHHIPYEKCDRFQKGCVDCIDEPLCKFRQNKQARIHDDLRRSM